MADQTIDIPGVGPVTFPAEMSDADIAKAAGRLHGDAQAAAAQQRASPEPSGSALERGVMGFARTNPLTGLYNLLTTNPWTTVKGIAAGHVDEGAKTIDALKRLVIDRDPLALSEAVGHGAATVLPLLGPVAAHAGELIGSGDVAGGLGEATGLLTGVAAPKVLAKTRVGRGATALGKWMEGAGKDIASQGVVKAASKAAIAPAVEWAGRKLQGAGGALEGKTPVAPGESAAGFPRLTRTPRPAPPPGGWTPEGPPPGESLPGYPRVTQTEAPPAPTPVPQPGESFEGYPRVTPTEAPAAPTPVTQPGESLPGYPRVTQTAPPVESPLDMLLNRAVRQAETPPPRGPYGSEPGYPRLTRTEPPAAPTPMPQPGESLEGFPRVTPTEAPAAPTPVPQPGESLEGFPRVTPTEAPATPTPVLQPGESLEGYPRGTVTPPPSIVETLTQRSGAPRAVSRPQTQTENLQARVAEPPAAPGEAITPELVDESRMPDALLTAEEKAARDAKSMDRTYQLADAGMKGADYAKAKFGTDYWPNLTDAQRAEVAAYERSLTGGVDVEAGQINQMVDATTRETFGRAYEDLLPHEQRSVDVLRSRLTGTDTPVTPTQKLAPAPETQIGIAPPDEGWITPGETLQSVGAPTPTGGRGFWSGLRRGDLWPQLQEEMLSTAEGPAPSSAAPPKSPGRTGPGAQGKGGRFAPKKTAAPAADVAPAPAATGDLETTLRARHAADVAEFNAGQDAARAQGYTGPTRKPSSFEAWLEDEADMGNSDAASWLTKNLTTRTGGR